MIKSKWLTSYLVFSNPLSCNNEAGGDRVDCQDIIDRYLTSSYFSCNTRFAMLSETMIAGMNDGSIGPIYPMEFQIRNCDPNGQPG